MGGPKYRCPRCDNFTALVLDAEPIDENHARFEMVCIEYEEALLASFDAAVQALPEAQAA